MPHFFGSGINIIPIVFEKIRISGVRNLDFAVKSRFDTPKNLGSFITQWYYLIEIICPPVIFAKSEGVN